MYASLAGQAERVAELDAALAALGDDSLDAEGAMHWEYLLLTAHRA